MAPWRGRPRCGGHPGVHPAVGGPSGEGRQVTADGDLHLRAGACRGNVMNGMMIVYRWV